MLSHEMISVLTPEDMPTDALALLARTCGMEMTMKIAHNFEGQSIYFGKYLWKNCLAKLVHKMLHEGRTQKEICKTLHITRQTYFRAMNMKAPKVTTRLKPTAQKSQVNLFDVGNR